MFKKLAHIIIAIVVSIPIPYISYQTYYKAKSEEIIREHLTYYTGEINYLQYALNDLEVTPAFLEGKDLKSYIIDTCPRYKSIRIYINHPTDSCYNDIYRNASKDINSHIIETIQKCKQDIEEIL